MKKRSNYIILILLLLVAGAAVYFFVSDKKWFINKKIKAAVRINSDSLYRLTFDSSDIDEQAGDATFYNVHLFVDSGILKDKINNGDSLPGILIDAKIENILIKGLKTMDLLKGNSIEADSIYLNKPLVTLCKFGEENTKKKATTADTLEIYRRLLGKFHSIKTNQIIIKNGGFEYNDPNDNRNLNVFGVSVHINPFLIDSLHNYTNIAAFFVKDAKVMIDSGHISTNGKKKNITLNNIVYDANQKSFSCDFLYAEGQRIDSVKFKNLSISDFIYKQIFNGQKLTISNVKLSLLKKRIQTTETIYLNLGDVFKEVTVDTLSILNGQLKFADKQSNQHSITGLSGEMYKITIDSNGLSLNTYLKQSSFRIHYMKYNGGESHALYSWDVHGLYYNATKKNIYVNELQLIPISKNEFYNIVKFQKDILSATFSNVVVYNCDLFEITENQSLHADKIDLSLNLNVYKDKTLPFDSASKTGKYPHQLIKKLKEQLNIPLINISKSKVVYTEKSANTLKTGSLIFSNIEGKLLHVNNNPANGEKMELNVSCLFMNKSQFSTIWKMPVSSTNGSFSASGTLNYFDLTSINPITTKLGHLEVQSGKVNKLKFSMNGNNNGSKGNVLFLYNDLTLNLLKQNKDSVVTRKLPSLILNAGIKNNNTKEEWVPFAVERESYRAFFYLLWKSVFEGVKNTVKK